MVDKCKQFYGWYLKLPKIEYDRVLDWQKRLVKLRKNGMVRDTLIFVEHPPVITVGKDGHEENYKNCPLPAVKIERGGDVTYHGPGQLVVYFICNLSRRGKDLHVFMDKMQNGIIEGLKELGIETTQGDEHTGIWVGKKKIASIGVAVKSWITYHGVAINLNTDLTEFTKINPCGLEAGVMTTAAKETGKEIDFDSFIDIMIKAYSNVFDTAFYPIQLEEIAEDIESQSGSNVI